MLFCLIFTLISLSAQAAVDLKVGDILLQPLDCWTCTLIEEEEDTIYSHIGIVLSVNPVMVAESRGKVQLVSLQAFNSITQKGQNIAVLRFQNEKAVDYFQQNQNRLLSVFRSDFEGLKYDHDFLWNNFDKNGNQMLYCSEMVAKLLQAFMGLEPLVKRMHFKHNLDQWQRYFKGNPPDGQWGNHPADFGRSELFYTVGEL
jgi:hypothetical protein